MVFRGKYCEERNLKMSKPTKQCKTVEARIRAKSADDEIVISGISGKFPKANNLNELSHNLYNKVITMKQKN